MNELISQQQVEQFREAGYFMTDVVFEPDELRAMSNEMDRVYSEHLREVRDSTDDEEQIRSAEGRRAFGSFHKLSQVADEFTRAPIYLEASRKIIGQEVDLYYNQAAVKPPQLGKIFKWHQDSGYRETVPLEFLTCWTAISDSNLANGCIWVIPGSHKRGVLPHELEQETGEIYAGKNALLEDETGAIPVEMKAGQVAVFSSLMLHKSGPNTTTNSYRRGFVPQYHVSGVCLKGTGEPCGEQVPILRNGQLV